MENRRQIRIAQLTQMKQAPSFNVGAATAYNSKSYQYFKPYEADVKRILGTSAEWTSPEFAQVVYDWQGKNGFTGNWVDGKLGPATMGKMAKADSTLAGTYDPYKPWKQKHSDDRPSQKVVGLLPEVDRVRKEMGATNIPLEMLLGIIQVESGGKIDKLETSAGFREMGLFQVSEEEAQAIGADQDRIMRDRDYAIKTGIMNIRKKAEQVDGVLAQHPNIQQYFPKGSDMYWRMTMFAFSAGPDTMKRLITSMEASGEQFKDWDSVMRFAAANPGGFKHSPIKWSWHVARAFNLGRQMTDKSRIALSNLAKRRIIQARGKALTIVRGMKNDR